MNAQYDRFLVMRIMSLGVFRAPWSSLDPPLHAALADTHVSHADVHCNCKSAAAKRFDPATVACQLVTLRRRLLPRSSSHCVPVCCGAFEYCWFQVIAFGVPLLI